MSEVAGCVEALVARALGAKCCFVEVRVTRLSADVCWISADDDGEGGGDEEALEAVLSPALLGLARRSYERFQAALLVVRPFGSTAWSIAEYAFDGDVPRRVRDELVPNALQRRGTRIGVALGAQPPDDHERLRRLIARCHLAQEAKNVRVVGDLGDFETTTRAEQQPADSFDRCVRRYVAALDDNSYISADDVSSVSKRSGATRVSFARVDDGGTASTLEVVRLAGSVPVLGDGGSMLESCIRDDVRWDEWGLKPPRSTGALVFGMERAGNAGAELDEIGKLFVVIETASRDDLTAADRQKVGSLLRGCVSALAAAKPLVFESARQKKAAAIAAATVPIIVNAIESMAVASLDPRFRDRVRSHPALDLIRTFDADLITSAASSSSRRRRTARVVERSEEDSQRDTPPTHENDTEVDDDWLDDSPAMVAVS